ncbi:MAG: 3-methyladenine glycosylase, partial [Lacunisphaera sp.]|nr:3-methyladenine glycosylase [Lacunisphaera sp.]
MRAANRKLTAQRRLASGQFVAKSSRMARVIQANELQGRNTVALARWLLGKALVRTTSRGRTMQLITEVEAYHSERDLACHARKGRTKRTEVMYR